MMQDEGHTKDEVAVARALSVNGERGGAVVRVLSIDGSAAVLSVLSWNRDTG